MKQNGGAAAKKAAGPLIKDASATAATNLNVLKRTDPDVEEVLGTAGHVCLYGFDVETKHRKEVEGSMFVVKRRSQPRFQFIIMNRLNMENLVQDVLVDFEFELSPPYLLYRTGNEVNGLWFYQQEECDQMTALLNRISGAFVKNTAGASAGAPAAPAATTTTEAPPVVVLRAPPSSAAPAAAAAAPPAAQRASRVAAAPLPAAPRASPPVSDAAGAVSKPPLLTPEILKQRAATDAAALAQPSAAPPLSAAPAPPSHAPALAATPTPAAAPAAGGLSRNAVRDAMLRLIMNETFVDMIHAELTKSLS